MKTEERITGGALAPAVWVAVAALVTKALVLWDLGSHPLLQPKGGLDGEAYVALARQIAGGNLAGGEDAIHLSPLYSYFLAPFFLIPDLALQFARLAQILLGAAAVGLLALAAAETASSVRAGWLSGTLMLLTGVFTFNEVTILQSSLDPFLMSLVVFFVCRATASATSGGGVAAGVALGLFALNRPNATLLAAAVFLAFCATRRFKTALRVLLGFVVVAFPFAVRNALLVGDYVPVASHGGLNLYIGNNPAADGTYVAVPGIRPNIEGQAADARVVAETALGKKLGPAAVSSYFARKAADFWLHEPAQAVSLFAKKIGLTLNRVDLALNQSFVYYQDSESPMLGFLLVGPTVLVPLGLLGLVATVRRQGFRYAPVVVLAPAYVLSVAVFFVSSRYRMPLLVPLALFSAIGIDWLIEALKARRLRELVPPLVAAALSLLVVLHDFRVNDGSSEEALAHIEFLIDNRRVEEAIEKTAHAEKKVSDLQPFRLRVGRAYLRQGYIGPAVAQLSKTEAGLMTEERLVIAEYFLVSGDPFSASRFFEAAMVSGQPRTAGLLGRYGEALALAGNGEAAINVLKESVALDPSRPRVLLNLAVTLANSGRVEEARQRVRASLALDPENAKAQALLRALDAAQTTTASPSPSRR